MDKEMMAKVEEFMKTKGRRELSMDETEQVVGGYLSFCGFEIKSDEDLYLLVYDVFKNIEATEGSDALAEILKSWVPSYTLLQDYQHAGLDGIYNHLGLVLFDRPGRFH